MTCKRLRLAVAVLVGLVLLGAPAARALPGIGGLEGPALPTREAPGFFASLWGLFTRLVPIFEPNRASIDPNGAQAAPDPNSPQAVPGSDNRASIDPDG
ncbi:MAG TPA: hypothetical protein VGS07_31930 [Thermoanaerobaculia bacterium]|jgi:hypothetical protein|nr:hypothetical protein [Thermoanaerobaculia bacterium]